MIDAQLAKSYCSNFSLEVKSFASIEFGEFHVLSRTTFTTLEIQNVKYSLTKSFFLLRITREKRTPSLLETFINENFFILKQNCSNYLIRLIECLLPKYIGLIKSSWIFAKKVSFCTEKIQKATVSLHENC